MPVEMSFWNHLEELRLRIIRSLACVIVLSFAAYYFSPAIVNFLIKPVGTTVFTAPAEALVVHVSVALWAGIFLSVPVIAYQLWRFVESALNPPEKSRAVSFCLLAFLLFVTGGVFGYFVLLPVMLNIFFSFNSPHLVPMISLRSYVDFALSTILCCGGVFETPIIAVFLAKLGIIDAQFLSRHRRAAILIIFIVAAVITPPDILSQFCMAIPMMLFYEFSIILIKCTHK